MLSNADYALLGFYFVFIFSLGFIFRKASSNASDYFRGSGSLMWWMVGASAFMQQVSAFTFTGVAGKAYRDGSIVVVVFFANALGYFVNYLWTASRFRQMRIITPIEAVRERYGKANEQFFTWVQVPVNVMYASIWLNGLAVFISAVFQIDLKLTILLTGGAVVFMSVTGGSWAVIASDFVQMLLIMIITVVAGILAINYVDIGGVSNFIEKAPENYFNWGEGISIKIVVLWVLASFAKQLFGLNNLMDSARFLCARDGEHARKAALLACCLMFVGPIIWFIPPMMAGIVEPDIGSIFPMLNNPGDAAYVYSGSLTLPAGMMGLLLCGMFAATMSSMDSALNRNSGIFVCNFYQVFLAPKASQSHLLVVGRIASSVLGVAIILAALWLSKLKGLTLFDIMLLYGGLVALPSQIPLTLGIFIKKTPPWSGWSTVLIGFAYSLFVVKGLDPHNIVWLSDNELSEREVNDFRFFAGVLGNIVICTSWFLFTKRFYSSSSSAFRERLDAFFVRMNTPIDFKKEHGEGSGKKQGSMLSIICYVYAAFIFLVGLFVSHDGFGSRLVYAAVSGVLALIGFALKYSSNKASEEM
ncbi:hypothetical protein MLD52_07735 [Puniceicoccaceae bacterium K14]|nr:hypothetical protein [Puniceicoccaceae bacterium K14]